MIRSGAGRKKARFLAGATPSERLCGDARQHQAFAAKLTPGGGLLESGTKKSGDSGWLGSTR
jgi:hypothetical protein